jgi:hypothetical protein
MSLYRQVGRPSGWVAAGAVAVLAAGLVLGFALARVTASEPTLGDRVAELRADAAPAADALELVSIHYGAKDETTRAAAREQLQRAEEAFAAVEPRLKLLAPDEAARARRAIDRLASLVRAGAPAREVEAAAAAARQDVRTAARLR